MEPQDFKDWQEWLVNQPCQGLRLPFLGYEPAAMETLREIRLTTPYSDSNASVPNSDSNAPVPNNDSNDPVSNNDSNDPVSNNDSNAPESDDYYVLESNNVSNALESDDDYYVPESNNDYNILESNNDSESDDDYVLDLSNDFYSVPDAVVEPSGRIDLQDGANIISDDYFREAIENWVFRELLDSSTPYDDSNDQSNFPSILYNGLMRMKSIEE